MFSNKVREFPSLISDVTEGVVAIDADFDTRVDIAGEFNTIGPVSSTIV